MTKRQLIEEIQNISPSTASSFLVEFDEPALQEYLNRLEDARQYRLRISSWPKKLPKERIAC